MRLAIPLTIETQDDPLLSMVLARKRLIDATTAANAPAGNDLNSTG